MIGLLKSIEIFIRSNILIVVIYILATETTYDKYIAVLSFLGILWIIIPILNDIPHKNGKPNKSK